MKIGLFTDTYFPQTNGVGTSTYTLANQLRRLGHQVYIFTPRDPKPVDPVYEEDVIRMPSMPFIFLSDYRVGLIHSPKTLSRIASLELDIIHTQTEFSLGAFGKTLSKLLGIPMVHTYHTMYEDYVHYIVKGYLISTSMAHFFSKMFCNFAAEVIAPTQKVRNSLLQYGVTKSINVIPTGINIEKFRKENYPLTDTLELKRSLGLQETDRVILFVGRIAKEKSIDTILTALPQVFKERQDIKFLVVGNGPYRETLEEQAKALGISNQVIFAGGKPWAEIGKYYQLGDIFISASVSETQGLTFIEAMAAYLPVIAKNDPCIDGVVENNKNGLIFETQEELSCHILTLLGDSALHHRLSQNAAAFAEKLSEESFAQAVEALYKQVLQGDSSTNKALIPSLLLGKRQLQESGKAKIYKIKRITKYELLQIRRLKRRLNKISVLSRGKNNTSKSK